MPPAALRLYCAPIAPASGPSTRASLPVLRVQPAPRHPQLPAAPRRAITTRPQASLIKSAGVTFTNTLAICVTLFVFYYIVAALELLFAKLRELAASQAKKAPAQKAGRPTTTAPPATAIQVSEGPPTPMVDMGELLDAAADVAVAVARANAEAEARAADHSTSEQDEDRSAPEQDADRSTSEQDVGGSFFSIFSGAGWVRSIGVHQCSCGLSTCMRGACCLTGFVQRMDKGH